MNKPTIFISYSHLDEDWKDRVLRHLGVSQKQGHLELWHDRLIGAGEDWERQIQDAMNAASVAVLLVSANSLTSDFILCDEICHLLQRRATEGLRIFPIIIKPCDWEAVDWLRRMNLRPKDGKPLSGGDDYEIDLALALQHQRGHGSIPVRVRVDRELHLLDDQRTHGHGLDVQRRHLAVECARRVSLENHPKRPVM